MEKDICSLVVNKGIFLIKQDTSKIDIKSNYKASACKLARRLVVLSEFYIILRVRFGYIYYNKHYHFLRANLKAIAGIL